MANQQRTTSILENDQRTISESPAHSRTTRKSFVSMSSDLYFIYFYIYFTRLFIVDARLYTKVCIARNGHTNELNINKMFGLGNMWEMRPLFYNLLNRAHGRMLLIENDLTIRFYIICRVISASLETLCLSISSSKL